MQGSGAIIHGLTWDCSAEFAATADQPISLLHENSFISFPNWISKTGAILTFRVSNEVIATSLTNIFDIGRYDYRHKIVKVLSPYILSFHVLLCHKPL